VTGATGLIGGHLARRLTGEGLHVRALVRPGSSVEALEESGVELCAGDLGDAQSVQCSLRGASHVYHCGGYVTDWGPKKVFQRTNVDGTRHVVEGAVAHNVERLVHLSSAAVYGYPPMELIGEQQRMRSRGIPYIATKIAAEKIVWRAIERDGLCATILRPVMVFGPGSQNYVAQIARHLRDRSMALLDRGRHVAGLAYVENVVDCIVLASRAPTAVGQAMNVWDGSPVTWKQYINTLASGIGAPPVRVSIPTSVAYALAVGMEGMGRVVRRRQRPWLTRLAVLELGQAQRYDLSRVRELLGYNPRVPFDEAMSATVDWANTYL
jgi:nucleoside-diphosphate-sugar epimerase